MAHRDPSEFETGYQPLGSYYDDDHEEAPPNDDIIHEVPENGKARWNHIENLDEFFMRVYKYHQRHGFWCMVVEDVLQLVQFLFVVVFSSYLLQCVRYEVLFANVMYKVTFNQVVIPLDVCIDSLDPMIVICLVVATVFLLFRLIKVICNIFKYTEIRAFFTHALKISSTDLPNLTWHEVQKLMLDVQKEQQMCIHKQELTQLDIYHRILRFKNYMIAMINKNLLPIHSTLPLLGDWVFMSQGMKYNLEMILFWGPWAPFQNNWHLKPDYKSSQKRKQLAEELSQKILCIGLMNLVFAPVIFLWQILYSFFQYAELIKREPGQLGARRWSHYARLYLRHFNELDHEFNARLSRGYKASSRYMDIFVSPLVVLLAKNVVFFFGSILVVLILLTVIDEDTLNVSHMITTLTVLTITVTVARSLIPDEHMVWCPEMLMRKILSEIHYMPDAWKGNAHTYKCRNEFSQLFQYKITYLLEELLSPVVTPLLLICSVRHRAQEIVDFYRHFTVEVVGVGDVCSFAQLNVRKHGHPQWTGEEVTKADVHEQAENGKTELSLMHFTLTNPEWKPPADCSMFLNNIREHAVEEASLMPGVENALYSSVNTLSSLGGPGYTSFLSTANPSFYRSTLTGVTSSQHPVTSSQYPVTSVRGGGVSKAEGPLGGSGASGLLSLSLQTSPTGGATSNVGNYGNQAFGNYGNQVSQSPGAAQLSDSIRPRIEEGTLEMMSAEMSLSVLYLHELHHRQKLSRSYHDLEARTAYQFQEQEPQAVSPAPTDMTSQLPSIQEIPSDHTSSYHGYTSPGQRYSYHGYGFAGRAVRAGQVESDQEFSALSPMLNLSGALGSPQTDTESNDELRLSAGPDDPDSVSPDSQPPIFQSTHQHPQV